MDFDQLNSFLEVAKLSSFSKAAERCFRTQPAISSQIRAVEEEVGAKLFDRSGAKVTLTVAGKAFQTFAEEAHHSLKSIKTAIAEMERTPRGEIVVGANEATCLYVLPHIFAEYSRKFPSVQISIYRNFSHKVLEKIERQNYDVLAARPSVSKIERVGLLLSAITRRVFSKGASAPHPRAA